MAPGRIVPTLFWGLIFLAFLGGMVQSQDNTTTPWVRQGNQLYRPTGGEALRYRWGPQEPWRDFVESLDLSQGVRQNGYRTLEWTLGMAPDAPVQRESFYVQVLPPRPPVLQGARGGTVEPGLDTPSLMALTETGDWIHEYSFISVPGTALTWNSFTGTIPLPAQDSAIFRGKILLRSRSPWFVDLVSDLVIYDVIQDRILPRVPETNIVGTAWIGNAPFTLVTEADAPVEIRFLERSGDEGREDWTAISTLAVNPGTANGSTGLLFDVPAGTSQTWVFQLRSRKANGNTSETTEAYRITVDKEPPSPPVLLGRDPQGETRILDREVHTALALDILAQDPATTYRVRDGTLEPFPGTYFLVPSPGIEHTEILEVLAMDAAGNRSESVTYILVMDALAPDLPAAPELSRQGNQVIIQWPAIADSWETRLSPQDPFQMREAGEWRLEIPREPGTLRIEYRVADRAGNVSKSGNLSFDYRLTAPDAPPPLKDGSRVAGRGEVPWALPPGGVQVRYLLGETEQVVNESSPLAGPTLSWDVPRGSTRTLVLSYRSFHPDMEPSVVRTLTFVADAEDPPPPQANLAPGTSLQVQGREALRIAAPLAGTRLRVVHRTLSASWDDLQGLRKSYDQTLALSPDLDRDTFTLDLGTPTTAEDTVRIDIVRAQTVDEVGNLSGEPATWVFWDQPGTLVVGHASSGPGNGTLASPLANIPHTPVSGIRRLVLSQGTHELPPVVWEGDREIWGGFDPGTWAFRPLSDEQPSVILPRGAVTEALILQRGGSLTIRDLYIIDGAHRVGSLLTLDRADFQGERIYLALARSPQAMMATQSTISIANSRLAAQGEAGQRTLMIEGGTLRLEGTNVEYVDLPPSLLRRNLQVEYTLVQTRGSTVTMIDSRIMPRRGYQTRAFLAEDSVIDLQRTLLGTGAGISGALALEARRSQLTLDRVQLQGNREATYGILARLEDSTLEGEALDLQLSASLGSYGILATGSQITLGSGTVSSQGNTEYQSVISLNNAIATLSGFQISLAPSAESTLMRLVGSNGTITGTRYAITGNQTLAPLQVLDGSSLDLSGSEIRVERGLGAVYLVPSMMRLVLKDNTFSGFSSIAVSPVLGQGMRPVSEDEVAGYGRSPGTVERNRLERGL